MNLKLVFTSLLTIATISGCQTTPKVDKLDDSSDVTAEIAALQQKIAAAEKDQQNVLATKSFDEAQHYLNEAIAERDNGSNKDSLRALEKGNAWIRETNELAAAKKEDFKEILAARSQALGAGAATYAGTELKKADAQLEKYTDTKSSAKFSVTEKENLQRNYIETNIIAQKNHYLSAARDALKKSKEEGAASAVPNTLTEVEKSLQNAEVFADGNYYKEAEFAQMAKGVEDSANRLLNLTREAQVSKNKTPEQIALDKEAAAKQIEASKQAAAASQQDAAQKAAMLSKETSAVQAYKTSEQKELAVRGMFAPNEADVVRTSEGVVIRLKGLKYASGKSELTASDFKLLAKARDALRTLGAKSIVIEGHTDAVGGSAKNKVISEQRAKAVKQYFESSTDLKGVSITAEGAGDQKPLSSNKTTIGRAQNRRVDLILKETDAGTQAM